MATKNYDVYTIKYGTLVSVTKDHVIDIKVKEDIKPVITTETFMASVVNYDPESYLYTIRRITRVLDDGWYCRLEFAYADELKIKVPTSGTYGPKIHNEDDRIDFNDGFTIET